MPAKTTETSAKPKGKPGRPRGTTKLQPDEKTLQQLSGLAKIHCTTREAAAVLGVNYETFRQFLVRHEKARQVWDDGKEIGRASLRRSQFKMSDTNPTMAIWLGKQTLGQKDQVQQTHDATDAFSAALAGIMSKQAVFPGDDEQE